MDFYKELYESLWQSGFQPAKRLIPNEYDETGRLRGFIKTDGPVWYGLILSDYEAIDFKKILEINEYFSKTLEEATGAYKARRLIILNLIIAEDIDIGLKAFVDTTEEFYDQPVNHVYWGVNKITGEIYYNKKQPSKLVNLENIIPLCVQEDGLRPDKITVNKNNGHLLTYFLMLINCLIFALLELNGGSGDIRVLLRFGAIEPGLIIGGHEYYRLFTAMFLHGGISHLLYNMFSLYIFGTRIEDYYGRIRFLIIYILSGLAGSIFSVLFTQSVSVGASGAIFGLVGAIAAWTYKSKGYLGGLNSQTMAIYILVSVGFGFVNGKVDNFGHLGGLLAGALISFILLSFKKAEKRD